MISTFPSGTNPFTEILLIDDASQDSTVAIALMHTAQIGLTNVRVMKNARNQGYGGSQKVGYAGTDKFFLPEILSLLRREIPSGSCLRRLDSRVRRRCLRVEKRKEASFSVRVGAENGPYVNFDRCSSGLDESRLCGFYTRCIGSA
jgi:glycosyltransferase involved in cell wall biosynthesis